MSQQENTYKPTNTPDEREREIISGQHYSSKHLQVHTRVLTEQVLKNHFITYSYNSSVGHNENHMAVTQDQEDLLKFRINLI